MPALPKASKDQHHQDPYIATQEEEERLQYFGHLVGWFWTRAEKIKIIPSEAQY